MTPDQLIYFADPMCSWCWGFSPVIAAARERYRGRLALELVLGGLAVGTRRPLDARGKQSIREHWEHVAALAGQPFDFGFFERDGFVYDTEPACRAVVAARRLEPGRALDFLTHLQRAFYAGNRDITSAATLTALAREFGFPPGRFAAELDADATRQETRADFETARRHDVDGYPALLAGNPRNGYSFITFGYQPWRKIEGIIDSWLDGRQQATPD